MGPNVARTTYHCRVRRLVLPGQTSLAASAHLYLPAMANRRVTNFGVFADPGNSWWTGRTLVESQRSSAAHISCRSVFYYFAFSRARFLRRVFFPLLIRWRSLAVSRQYRAAR